MKIFTDKAYGEIKRVSIGDRELVGESVHPKEVVTPSYSNPYWLIKLEDGTLIITDQPVLLEFRPHQKEEKDD